ncbi:MAG: hypothetical protein QME71_04100 [Dehalococcoidia bacterium]|nr:hypothetical protein [Dehalococcoidia bacterium]
MRKELPVIVGAFAEEEQADAAVAGLKAFDLEPDLIGVSMRVDGRAGDAVHLVGVMAPPRLRGQIERLFLACDALLLGGPAEALAAFGAVPHPGVIEDGDVKLPSGREYHDSTNGRAR